MKNCSTTRESEPEGPRSSHELVGYIRADKLRSGSWLHPATRAVMWFRLSQYLWRSGRRRAAKMVEWRQMRRIGCQLAPSARVGPSLLMPHPIGIVLGGRTTLGSGVLIGQHVTLGSGRTTRGANDQPNIGDHVALSAGCVVAGPVPVGSNARIGANAVVTFDVAAGVRRRPLS